MLVVVQFSDGVTAMLQVPVLVDLKSVVMVFEVIAHVKSSQMEFHFERSVALRKTQQITILISPNWKMFIKISNKKKSKLSIIVQKD